VDESDTLPRTVVSTSPNVMTCAQPLRNPFNLSW